MHNRTTAQSPNHPASRIYTEIFKLCKFGSNAPPPKGIIQLFKSYPLTGYNPITTPTKGKNIMHDTTTDITPNDSRVNYITVPLIASAPAGPNSRNATTNGDWLRAECLAFLRNSVDVVIVETDATHQALTYRRQRLPEDVIVFPPQGAAHAAAQG
ncbi:hypothetical protein QEH59_03040 [Coraliomargarita sp. SDUM461004]|uniref:Uncharacterized protein n=1 Tax=Thalassobacterium sedimentorum TaxID=3041258 RepID=A0ABU1AFQ1_9BACT|nr:hypothetical protein [Coraliomargarita sp. SDUM461004]MDQ8193384.1 hypothetical protein [Coraliomargarita sp. SDUM461004]